MVKENIVKKYLYLFGLVLCSHIAGIIMYLAFKTGIDLSDFVVVALCDVVMVWSASRLIKG